MKIDNKNPKGSALAATLIILGIILTTAMSMALVSVREKRSAVTSGRSVVSYQAADQGIELTLNALLKSGKTTIEEINDDNKWGTDASCSSSKKIKNIDYNYEVELLNEADGHIDCDANQPITDVKYLKSSSISDEARGTQRAVRASVPNVNQYTKLLLHMDGEDGDTNFSDSGSSNVPHGVTASGDVKISTGGAINSDFKQSAALDGIGDYLEVDVSTENENDFNFGEGDFTIDWWEKRDSTSPQGSATFQWSDDTNSRSFAGGYKDTDNNVYFIIAKNNDWNNIKISMSAVGDGSSWVHFAVVRKGNDIYTFRNGQQQTKIIFSEKFDDANGNLDIGRFSSTGDVYFKGNIDEFRISKGIARWTDDFTPQDKPYAAD